MAKWCEVCRESATDVYNVERGFNGRVNFVALDIDDPKWSSKLDQFSVDSVPHFEFIDANGQSRGSMVGKMPREVLTSKTAALLSDGTNFPEGTLKVRNIFITSFQGLRLIQMLNFTLSFRVGRSPSSSHASTSSSTPP